MLGSVFLLLSLTRFAVVRVGKVPGAWNRTSYLFPVQNQKFLESPKTVKDFSSQNLNFKLRRFSS